jgi:DNA gyrase subunit B
MMDAEALGILWAVWAVHGAVSAALTSESDAVSPVLSFIGEIDDTTVHAAMAWTVDGRDTSIGYANGVSTPEGACTSPVPHGDHRAVQVHHRPRPRTRSRCPPRDISARRCRGSIMILARSSPATEVEADEHRYDNAGDRAAASRWLEENPSDAAGADLVPAMRSALSNAEQQAARALLSKGSKSRNGLPPKLRDCTGKSGRPKELLLVEGDSAGGTALDARDPSFQAILPLRGKPLNTYKETVDRVVKSLADLILSMGCGIGDDFDLDKFPRPHVRGRRRQRRAAHPLADEAFLYTWCPGLPIRPVFYAPSLWSTMSAASVPRRRCGAAGSKPSIPTTSPRSRMKGPAMDHQSSGP